MTKRSHYDCERLSGVIHFIRGIKNMKKTTFSNSLSFIVCIVLTAAIALFTTACDNSKSTTSSAAPSEVSSVVSTVSETPVQTADETASSEAASDAQTEKKTVGEGSTTFLFTVTDADGNDTNFEVHTDKTTVGDALLELGLIAGDDSAYGLYVKTVNGVTVDYDTDGKYWAFYVDGEYASAGVDSTEISEGAVYAFKVE